MPERFTSTYVRDTERGEYAVVPNAETIPGARLHDNTYLNFAREGRHRHSARLEKSDGELVRTVAARGVEVEIISRLSPLAMSDDPAEDQRHHHAVNIRSAPVSLAIRSAVERAFSNDSLSGREALQLESLRQYVSAAGADGNFDPNETRNILARASRIAPEGNGRG